MQCRSGCGACCIIPSISSAFVGMPKGKPAGVRCIHLLQDYRCALFGLPERPDVCANFKPELAFCGDNREQAMLRLVVLEQATQ